MAFPHHVFVGEPELFCERVDQTVLEAFAALGVVVEHPWRKDRVTGAHGELARSHQRRMVRAAFPSRDVVVVLRRVVGVVAGIRIRAGVFVAHDVHGVSCRFVLCRVCRFVAACCQYKYQHGAERQHGPVHEFS